MPSKKQLILCVWNLLNNETDKNNPLTQVELVKRISGEKYSCDRKTVCRNIKFLQEMGYPIKKTNQGFYMEKTFSLEDIAFIKTAILFADGKSEEEKLKLASSVVNVLTKQCRR